MKIEMIKSNSLTNNIKDISDRFGPSALILRNIEADGQEILFIAHEKTTEEFQIKLGSDAPVFKGNRSSINDFHDKKKEIARVKSELKKLPDSLNGQDEIINNKPHEQSKAYGTASTRLTNNKKQAFIEEDFRNLLEDTPISRYLKKLLSGYLDKPSSKSELLSQIELGLINNLPDTKEIRLDSQIHVLTGGHGTGKTSIALKIASQLCKANKNNVGIISVGVNVHENEAKLKMLSESIDVPSFCVKNLNELAKLLYLEQSNNIYIIDLELDSASQAIPFIRGIYNDAQFHLVSPTDISLPAFWANCELDKWDSIILTRLDSALVPWAAIEALSKFKIPLSIGSIGSEIASGLVRVTKGNISRKLIDYIDDHISDLAGKPSDKQSMKARALH
jgi:flagellar biosynthesis GTPase FlhF